MNETVKQLLKGMRNANFQPSRLKEMKETIRLNGGKVRSASVDPDEATVKFPNGDRFTVKNF